MALTLESVGYEGIKIEAIIGCKFGRKPRSGELETD